MTSPSPKALLAALLYSALTTTAAAAASVATTTTKAPTPSAGTGSSYNKLTCQLWSWLDTPCAASLRWADLSNTIYTYASCANVCVGTKQRYLAANASTGLLVATPAANVSIAEKFIIEECTWPALGYVTAVSSGIADPSDFGYAPRGLEASRGTYLRIRPKTASSTCLTLPNFNKTTSAPNARLQFKRCDNSAAGIGSQLFQFNLTTQYAVEDPREPIPTDYRNWLPRPFQHFKRPPGQGKQTIFNVQVDRNADFKYEISKPQNDTISTRLPQFCIDGRKDYATPYFVCE